MERESRGGYLAIAAQLTIATLLVAWACSGPKGADEAQDFFQVAFARADPLVTEVLQFRDRDAGLAGETFNQRPWRTRARTAT